MTETKLKSPPISKKVVPLPVKKEVKELKKQQDNASSKVKPVSVKDALKKSIEKKPKIETKKDSSSKSTASTDVFSIDGSEFDKEMKKQGKDN